MSRRSLSVVFGVMLLAGLSTSTYAQVNERAFEILRSKIMAQGTVNFSGRYTVVLFENGVKVQGYEEQVYQKNPGKLRITVIAPESGKGRLSVTNGQVQWEYSPGDPRVVRREMPSLEEIRSRRLAGLERLRERMRIDYLGTDTIAGRQVHVVQVGTTQGVLLKKTWVDAQHLIPLKTQLFDCNGNLKCSSFYTAINFSPQYAAGMFDFEPPAGCHVHTTSPLPERMTLREAEAAAGFRAARPTYLPPGYRFLENQVAVMNQGSRVILWLPFSNAVDTFSIFQRRVGVPAPPGSSGRSLTWTSRGFRFVLVGNLSAEQLRQIRDSVGF